MLTLVYKRTHHGDPDATGRFGCRDCMGRVRSWTFDAVIGIGGLGPEPRQHNLAGKVNWVGIGPHVVGRNKRGPILAFEQFFSFGTGGPLVRDELPNVARRMYGGLVRATTSFGPRTQQEIDDYLRRFMACDPSPALTNRSGVVLTSAGGSVCRPRVRSGCRRLVGQRRRV